MTRLFEIQSIMVRLGYDPMDSTFTLTYDQLVKLIDEGIKLGYEQGIDYADETAYRPD